MLAMSITAQPMPICHVITSPKNRTPHNVPNIGTEYVTLDEAVGPKNFKTWKYNRYARPVQKIPKIAKEYKPSKGNSGNSSNMTKLIGVRMMKALINDMKDKAINDSFLKKCITNMPDRE